MNKNLNCQNNDNERPTFECPPRILVAIGPTGPTGPAGPGAGATGPTYT